MIKLSKFIFYNIDKSIKDRGLQVGGKTQKYIDRQVLEKSERYIPKDTGKLESSGKQATRIGSGNIIYNTPYAKAVYYTQKNYNNSPQRGAYWLERMKSDRIDEIRDGAAKIAGGESKE